MPEVVLKKLLDNGEVYEDMLTSTTDRKGKIC